MADPTTTTLPAEPKPPAEPKAARKATPKLKHLDGCPAKADRVEQFDTGRGNRDHTTTPFEVTRCQDCGAQEAKPK